jgi:type IV pilus assembly protein PilA
MIVVAIIGILAAIAIPAYQIYTTKAKVIEGLSLAADAQTAVVESYQANGMSIIQSGYDLGGAYPEPSSKYVGSVQIDQQGNVIVTFGVNAPTQIAGTTLVLTPFSHGYNLGSRMAPAAASNSAIDWGCASSSNAVEQATVANGGGPPFATTATLPAQYAPGNCI